MNTERESSYSPMVTLVVKDLMTQIHFYREYVGLQLHWHDEHSAWLGVDDCDLLRLVKDTTDRIYPAGRLALKLSSRCELSRVVARLCTVRYSNEVIDHGTRQSAYLHDSEGNEVELYVEGENKVKPESGRLLDLENLFNELKPDDRLCDGLSAETVTGVFLPKK